MSNQPRSLKMSNHSLKQIYVFACQYDTGRGKLLAYEHTVEATSPEMAFASIATNHYIHQGAEMVSCRMTDVRYPPKPPELVKEKSWFAIQWGHSDGLLIEGPFGPGDDGFVRARDYALDHFSEAERAVLELEFHTF